MKSRNTAIDVFKGIACLGVVLMHCKFPEPAGTAFRSLGCFGVPFFFFVSGYFLTSTGDGFDSDALLRKIRHIVKLILVSEVFYCSFAYVVYHLYDDQKLANYIEGNFKEGWFLKFIISNQPPVYTHLWFLYTLLTLYLIVLLFLRSQKSLRRISYIAVPVFTLAIVLLQEFKDLGILRNSFKLNGTDVLIYRSSCFPYRAVPFFLLGFLARNHEDRIKRIKIGKGILIILIIVSMILAVAEGFTFLVAQFYVGNIIALYLIMIFCIKYPSSGIKPLRYLGEALSTSVYIIHMAVIKLVDLCAGWISISELMIYKAFRPIVVIAVSIAVSQIIHVCSRYLAEKRTKVK